MVEGTFLVATVDPRVRLPCTVQITIEDAVQSMEHAAEKLRTARSSLLEADETNAT